MAILRSKIETVTAWKVSKYGVISGPYFPVFGLNTEIYFINFCIQSEYRKIQARNNSVFGHFLRSEFCWYKLKFIFMCFDVGLKCINQNHCKSLLDSKENTWWKVLQIFYNFLIHIWTSHTASIFFYLNPFQPIFHFYIPWKHQKTGGFLMFSGGIEVEHWLKMG